MLSQLKQLAADKQIRLLDYQFAQFIAERGGDPLTQLCSALVSFELGKGNVCLVLEELDQLFDLPSKQLFELVPPVENWPEHLARSHCVGSGAPLVIWSNRLYLSRYFNFEQQVVARLAHTEVKAPIDGLQEHLSQLFSRDYDFLYRSFSQSPQLTAQEFANKYLDLVDPSQVNWKALQDLLEKASSGADLAGLAELVPQQACLNWQKVAVAVAATSQVSVISGGPGTGKTTTVSKLLALLVRQGLEQNKELHIKLAAPTGKAAARLTESITGALGQLALAKEVTELIPTQASTIHRLLGVIPGRSVFRRNQDNPLHLDVLVVDEASMVDLPLMAKLLQALPPGAKLVLLGDKDQLASVEAGSVLGDICSFAETGYGPEKASQLSALTGYKLSVTSSGSGSGINNQLCLLRKSYRFDANSGIGTLARAVNSGQTKLIPGLWDSFGDIRQTDLNERGYQDLLSLCLSGYSPYLHLLRESAAAVQDKARSALAAFNRFQLLCAVREGYFGVKELNDKIEGLLRKKGLLPTGEFWYPGRPVIIMQNDHGLGLFNGDIGICLADEAGKLRVYFELSDGLIHDFLPSRLPQHETVFAMTVHKSQGSEFAHTVLVLPDQMNPVLSRELVYTGITRAKKQLDLFARPQILALAVKQKTQRASGLAMALA